MKTTPIYILLIIFFLNFDLAWGLTRDKKLTPYLFQGMYSVNNSVDEIFHSINIVYDLGTTRQIIKERTFNRLRLNIGLSKILTEIDYNLGYRVYVEKYFAIEPYISIGTNIYSVGYGGGLDINIPTKSRFFITGNINYRTTEKLFGHTDAKQWYQSGFGAKIGVGFIISTYEDPPVNFYQYDDY